ncbi:MAG: ribosome maturation factor RimM [bacterium]
MLIKVGFLGKPHGKQGDIFFTVFRETGWQPVKGLKVFVHVHTGQSQTYTICTVKEYKKGILISFLELTDRYQLKTLVNSGVSAQIDKLPDHTYKIADIVGSLVKTVDNKQIGTVVDVLSTGAYDLYQVKGEQGEILIPAAKNLVRSFDEKNKELVVDLPEGFL